MTGEFRVSASGLGWSMEAGPAWARAGYYSHSGPLVATVAEHDGHVWLAVEQKGRGVLQGLEFSIHHRDREWLQRIADAINSLPPPPPPPPFDPNDIPF